MRGFWLALGSHLWQSTIVLALVALAARALRRAPARAQEALWTAALLKLALPGSFLALLFGPVLSLWSPQPGSSSVRDAYALMVRVASPDLGAVTPAPPAADVGPGWVVLTLAWVVGSGVLMLHWWRRRRRHSDRDRPLDRLPEPLWRKVSDALSGTGFAAERVRLRSGAVIPAVRGIHHPELQLSEEVVRALSPAELRAVILHEDAHRRRRDVLRRWLERALASLLFFYPPIWWVLRRLDRAAELACDEAVLRRGVDPRTYAQALARTLRLRLILGEAPALAGDGSNLSERLHRIAAHGRYSMRTWHRLALGTTFVAVAAVVVVPLAGAGSPLLTSVVEERRLGPEDSRVVPGRVAPLPGESPAPGETSIGAGMPVEAQRPGTEAGDFADLDSADLRVDLEFSNVPVRQVLDVLGQLAGLEVAYDFEAFNAIEVSVAVRRTRVAEALALLARQTGLSIRVADARTVVVGAPVENLIGTLEDLIAEGRLTPHEFVRRVPPEYTERARGAGLEGTVRVLAIIDRQGRVRRAEVVRGLGLGLGLDEAALEAVRQWRFAPWLRDGSPVEVLVPLAVDFELRDQEAGRRDRSTPQLDPRGRVAEGRIAAGRDPDPGGPRGPMRVGGEIQEPERILYVSPEYPELARRARLEGVVVLQAIIDPEGNVSEAEVLRPLGLGVDEAAVEAVQQWKYTPTRYNGSPVEVILTVTVRFELPDEGPAGGFPTPEERTGERQWLRSAIEPDSDEPDRSDPTGPMWVGGEIHEPERIAYVNPVYPELARRARLEGVVVLQLVIDERGDVVDAEVLRSLGLGLDEAALEAARQWKYEPATYEGRPVEVVLTATVQFELIQ